MYILEEKCLFKSFDFVNWIVFLLSSLGIFVYSENIPYQTYHMLIFSPSLWFVFSLSIISITKVFHFDEVPFISSFVTFAFGILSKTLSANTRS